MTNHEIALLLARYMAATGDLPDELKALMTRDIGFMAVYFAWEIAQTRADNL